MSNRYQEKESCNDSKGMGKGGRERERLTHRHNVTDRHKKTDRRRET